MCGMILAPAHYENRIGRALESMKYRGPDELNYLRAGDWLMGHARLAIQDLGDTGRQPFVAAAGMAMFVGEFFGYPQGTEQLHVNWLLSDPLNRLHTTDGFWSLTHVVGPKATVYLDHLGIKPIYYWPKHQIVCSEFEPMFELEPRPALDEIYLANCIKFGYDYSGRTPYQGIHQLYPGLYLELEGKGSDGRLYWDWSKVPRSADSLRHVVERAIHNRLQSDRPVALLLSGGLDSSIIYHVLKQAGREIETFAIENGETEFLPEGVEPLKVESVNLKEAVAIMQAPMDLGSLVPQIQLARAVKDAGYVVCLTGDGADELFGGYRRAKQYDSQYSDIFCELPYYHLPRLDRVMMHSTVELRSPFLSPEVVAYGLSLSHPYRTHKQALKYAFTGVVPKEILLREKHPLKTQAVVEGGVSYRAKLVEEFRYVISRL